MRRLLTIAATALAALTITGTAQAWTMPAPDWGWEPALQVGGYEHTIVASWIDQYWEMDAPAFKNPQACVALLYKVEPNGAESLIGRQGIEPCGHGDWHVKTTSMSFHQPKIVLPGIYVFEIAAVFAPLPGETMAEANMELWRASCEGWRGYICSGDGHWELP